MSEVVGTVNAREAALCRNVYAIADIGVLAYPAFKSAADQDMNPHFDDLRPLYLQEPRERGRTFESVGNLEPPSAAKP